MALGLAQHLLAHAQAVALLHQVAADVQHQSRLGLQCGGAGLEPQPQQAADQGQQQQVQDGAPGEVQQRPGATQATAKQGGFGVGHGQAVQRSAMHKRRQLTQLCSVRPWACDKRPAGADQQRPRRVEILRPAMQPILAVTVPFFALVLCGYLGRRAAAFLPRLRGQKKGRCAGSAAAGAGISLATSCYLPLGTLPSTPLT